MKAAYQGDDTIVKILLNCGADANATDKQGHSVLRRIAIQGYERIANLLLEYGAGLIVQHREGDDAVFALCAATLNFNGAGIEYLQSTEYLQRIAVPPISTFEANDLSLAAKKGYEASVEVLREHKAVLKSKNDQDDMAGSDFMSAFSQVAWWWHHEDIITEFLAMIKRQQRILKLLVQDRAKKLAKMEEAKGKDEGNRCRVEFPLSQWRLNRRNSVGRSTSCDRPTLVSVQNCLLQGLTDFVSRNRSSEIPPGYIRKSSVERRMSLESVD